MIVLIHDLLLSPRHSFSSFFLFEEIGSGGTIIEILYLNKQKLKIFYEKDFYFIISILQRSYTKQRPATCTCQRWQDHGKKQYGQIKQLSKFKIKN